MKVFIDYRVFFEKELFNDAVCRNMQNMILNLELSKKIWGYCIFEKTTDKHYIYKFNFYEKFPKEIFSVQKSSNLAILSYLHQNYYLTKKYHIWLILDFSYEDYQKFGEYKRFLFSEPISCNSDKIENYQLLSKFYFEFYHFKTKDILIRFITELEENYYFGAFEKIIALEYIFLALITLQSEEKLLDNIKLPIFKYFELDILTKINDLFLIINDGDKDKFEVEYPKKILVVYEELVNKYGELFNESYSLIYKNSSIRNGSYLLNMIAKDIRKSNILNTPFFKEDKNSNRTKLNYIIRGKRSASIDFINSILDLIENKKDKIRLYSLFNEYNNVRAYLLQFAETLTFFKNEKYFLYYQEIPTINFDLSEILFYKKPITIENEKCLCNISCYPYSEKIELDYKILVILGKNISIISKNEVAKYPNAEKYFINKISILSDKNKFF